MLSPILDTWMKRNDARHHAPRKGNEMKARSNAVVSTLITGTTITFTVKDAGSFTFDQTWVSDACRQRAMIHGFTQRISDGAAISRNPENGQPATPADKLARMKRIADHYMSGAVEWGMKATAREPRAPKLDLAVIYALMDVLQLTREEVTLKVEGQAKAQGVTMAAYLAFAATKPKLAPIVAEKRAAMASESDIDSDELLDELDD